MEKLDLSSNELKKHPEGLFDLLGLVELSLFLSLKYDAKISKKDYDGLKNLTKLKSFVVSNDDMTEEEFTVLLPKQCTLRKY